MDKAKYDIFISYRRIGGKNYARTLKPELEKRGYRVFLDFDELKDGVFDKRIMDAINEAPIFLVILSKGALDRCANEGDWVREEILYAEKTNRHIVPVEVDKTFREFPENLPNEVKSVLGPHQFSQIDTETLLQESIDKMVRERIKPWVTKEFPNTLSREIESTDGAEIHIEVDADCDLYRFKKLIKALSPNEDNIVYLKPGKHKIEFVSHEYSDIKKSMLLDIPYENYSDFITVTLLPQIQNKKEEEAAKRKAEEEAKRKAEDLRIKEETKRKADAEARRKAEEDKRNAERTCKKGEEYYDKNDYSHAYPLFLEAAKQDHIIAQAYLGQMNYYGQGVNQDYAEAVKWYRKAAEQGYAIAQNNLGGMYFNGQGVNQDFVEAVKWYRKAAEQGNANAQYKLGSMYEYGQGVQRDYKEAYSWFLLAAEQKCVQAEESLACLYDLGLGTQQNHEEAFKWYYKAANEGNEASNRKLGKVLEDIEGMSYEDLKTKWCLLRKKEEDEKKKKKESIFVDFTFREIEDIVNQRLRLHKSTIGYSDRRCLLDENGNIKLEFKEGYDIFEEIQYSNVLYLEPNMPVTYNGSFCGYCDIYGIITRSQEKIDKSQYLTYKEYETVLSNQIIEHQMIRKYGNKQNVIHDYSEGLAIIEKISFWGKRRFGFIDVNGNIVIPCTWEYAKPFKDGKAMVKDSNGKWCHIDKTGLII